MSLVAPLLVLPAWVRRLRGNNAPEIPAQESLAPVFTRANNAGFAANDHVNGRLSSINPQAYETHGDSTLILNNAVETEFEVCNITGKGSIYGVWLVFAGEQGFSNAWMNVRASIVLDGVELVDPTWSFNSLSLPSGSGPLNYSNANEQWNIPFIGTVERIYQQDANSRVMINNRFVPVLKPLVFDSSLVIKLIHIESEAASDWAKRARARLSACVYKDA